MYNLGQYLPRSSVIHSTDSRIKIVGLLVLSIIILRLNLVGLGLALLGLLGVAALARITWGDLWLASRPMRTLFLVLLAVYLLFTPGTPLITVWDAKLYISQEGVRTGILQVGKFWLLVLAAAVTTMTTSQSELTVGLQKILWPLKVVGVSSHNVATMVSLAVRFVPTLQLEMERLREAQEARGANFRSIRAKVRVVKYMVIPLTIDLLRRSEELIGAMEARGFQPGPRTYLYEPAMSKRDLLGLVLLILVLAVVWWGRGLIFV